MNTRDIMKSAEVLLFICLIGSLVLSAFIFFFVFCIDWEDWFFGMKLEGLPAGIYLFAKMAGAMVILYLMVHYPRYRRQSVLLVFSYYGFLCLDALVTLRKNPAGRQGLPGHDGGPVLPLGSPAHCPRHALDDRDGCPGGNRDVNHAPAGSLPPQPLLYLPSIDDQHF